MSHNKPLSSDLTLLNMLQVLFVAYKLAGIIDWSWWWVLSPYLIATALVFFGTLIVGVKNAQTHN